MGRTRKPEDLWMPLRVYRGKSSYEYRPKGGKTVNLCALDAPQADVWEAYKAATEKPALTVKRLADRYFESRPFTRKPLSTQGEYRDCWDMLAKVWADVDAPRVQPKHVRAWMDKRGEKSEVRANREHSLLSNIFAYGYERGLVKLNPCKGVKKFPEEPRTRYIEDEEYYPYFDLSTPLCQLLMELSYLQGSRGKEVRLIKMADVRDMGVFVQTAKRGKKMIKEFTDRLTDAVEFAKRRREKILAALTERGKASVLSPYLIVNESGQPYTASGIKTMWARNKARIKQEHGISIDWTYHDIKAKGISDYEGNKQVFAGHQNSRTTEIYNRKTAVVATVQSEFRPFASRPNLSE
jgi:integrase